MGAGLLLLDAVMLYRDQKMSQYVWAPLPLLDSGGVFTLWQEDRGIFRSNDYYKKYKSGPLEGQMVPITTYEWDELRQEAEYLWGYVDWKGDFVPGLLRPKLPVITIPDPNMA